MEKLEDLYEPAFARLAAEDAPRFTPVDFPPPPRAIVTDGLELRRSARVADGYRHEQIWLLAEKSVFRRLALVLIAGLFNDPPEDLPIHVELTHPRTELPGLFIETRKLGYVSEDGISGWVRLNRFDWSFRELAKHPWMRGHLPADPYDLPRFNYSDLPNGSILGFKPPTGLNIQGNWRSQARLINLLLTLSDPRSEGVEFVLEGEDGFRGVGPASIEAAFWLPGSILW